MLLVTLGQIRAQDSRKKNDSPRGLTQEAMSAVAGNNCHLMNSNHVSDLANTCSSVPGETQAQCKVK